MLASLTQGGNLPFRRLCVALGADLTISEMLYARFLLQGKGREKALLRRHESEKCFGVQFITSEPQETLHAAELAQAAGASFVDLNCACPIDEVVRRGLGAALLKRPKKIAQIVETVSKGIALPMTVKLRTGWEEDKPNIIEVAKMLEECGAAALFVHGRSRAQRYTKAAAWDIIRETAAAVSIPVIGNGDILTHYEAKSRKNGVAGVMVGRGALIKPWIFSEIKDDTTLNLSARDRLGIYFRLAGFMKEHFGTDAHGLKRVVEFLAWHFSFFYRYEYLPEAEYGETAKEYPLLQSRLEPKATDDPLELILRSPDEAVHRKIAEVLANSGTEEECVSMISATTLQPCSG